MEQHVSHKPREQANPLIGTFYHAFADRNIEFSNNLPLHERLRLIADFSTISLDFERIRLEAFLPSDMAPKPFNKDSVGHPSETELAPPERAIRSRLMEYLGYISPSKKGKIEIGDIANLNVAFTNKPNAIVTQVNNLPGVRRQKNIAQTEPGIMTMPQSEADKLGLQKTSLFDHINHLGYSFAMTNIRLAIQQPELYLKRNDMDVAELKHQYKERYGEDIDFSFDPSEEIVRMVDEELGVLDAEPNDHIFMQRKALGIAVQKNKYHEIYIKHHDLESPALKDVVMQARSRVEGQRSADISEDTRLIKTIEDYVYNELAPIIKSENLNPELLKVLVASLASENSPTLGGYLIKDKRKGLAGRKGYEFLPKGQGYDHDQGSGTGTNGQFLINRFLPGGFVYKKKQGEAPIGSFEERMRILAYAVVTRMDKATLSDMLTQLSIDPKLVYISAEEIDVAPNIVLREIRGTEGQSEIMPVALVPGDVKRGITLQNFLYTFYYFGSDRYTHELLVQDAITFGLGSGKLREEMFLDRNDYDMLKLLKEFYPSIEMLIRDRKLTTQAFILSKDELSRMADRDGTLHDVLVTKIINFPNPIMTKSGTLVEDDNKTVLPYLEVIGQKKSLRSTDPTGVDPFSLKVRQQSVSDAVKGEWYLMIQLDDEQKAKIVSTLPEEINDPGRQALMLWTEPIDIGERVLQVQLREVLFSSRTMMEGRSDNIIP